MTDDDPLDMTAVAADDAAVERLRTGRPAGADPVLGLLRDLLSDVEADLPAPAPPPVPVGRGSTILTLVGDDAPERRLARGGTVVAVLAAGLVSLGGVAAASTLLPPGTPLHGIGQAVRSAAGAVVGAVSPPQPPVRPRSEGAATTSPPTTADREAAPQEAQAATAARQARSQAAARQVTRLLDQAEGLLSRGRTDAAGARLDLAQRRLGEVLVTDRPPLATRLEALRARLADQQTRQTSSQKAGPQRPAAKAPAPSSSRKAAPAPGPKRAGGEVRKAKGGSGDRRPAGQLSDSDASAKPRA